MSGYWLLLGCDKVSKSGSNLPISSSEKPAKSAPTSTGNSVPKLRGDNLNGVGTVSPSLSHPRLLRQYYGIFKSRDIGLPPRIGDRHGFRVISHQRRSFDGLGGFEVFDRNDLGKKVACCCQHGYEHEKLFHGKSKES